MNYFLERFFWVFLGILSGAVSFGLLLVIVLILAGCTPISEKNPLAVMLPAAAALGIVLWWMAIDWLRGRRG